MHWLIHLHHLLFGSIVAVRVSPFEERELDRFVDECLTRYRLAHTEHNRALLLEILHAYPGGKRPQREALTSFLDEVFRHRR